VGPDAIWQEFIEFLGLRVLRFTNQQVFLGIDEVIGLIGEAVRAGRGTPS